MAKKVQEEEKEFQQLAISELPLWAKFEKKATSDQITMIKKHIIHAASLLDGIRDTFRTYTLHSYIHAKNLVDLMGKILGDKLENATTLELAIFILSAYYHDIGMVYRESELNKISGEEDFDKFKKEHPEADVAIHKNDGEIPKDIAEWYCRWNHPNRIYGFLSDIEDGINWGVVSLINQLGGVCKSHGYGVDKLRDLRTDFLSDQADLRFCAILLRLADILDFDHTRSPEAVYDYLEIASKDDESSEKSVTEWQKHLCSDGFKFPDERTARYTLGFVAGPDHPSVEHDVREFLDQIEDELIKCCNMLSDCSERWKKFILPNEISRKDILSKGYKYGEYRFTLEQKSVLDLFMGENLYDNPYVFVRELLQNAIDTCRHHKFYEINKGNDDHEPKVTITEWDDNDSYHWVRVDDNGMGMDENKIIKYLLKVGKSYYSSAEFEAEKLTYKKPGTQDFTPISRFGIGLLSCFIAGDTVEISTRAADNDDPIRLSISGLHGFYVFQHRKEHRNPKEMPSSDEDEKEYRRDTGTSIAVRLNPSRDTGNFNLKELLDMYVFCPPVPIEFEGETIGGDPEEILEKPWVNGIEEEKFGDEDIEKMERTANYKFREKPGLRFLCLDLTKHSPTPNLKGQILLAYLPKEYLPSTESEEYRVSFEIGNNNNILLCIKFIDIIKRRMLLDEARKLSFDIEIDENEYSNEFLIRITDTLKKKIPKINSLNMLFNNRYVMLAHNGIRFPSGNLNLDEVLGCDLAPPSDSLPIFITGVISLYDHLRPNISLSRDFLRSLSWDICSPINLAFLKAIESYKGNHGIAINGLDVFRTTLLDDISLGTILHDPYISPNKEWSCMRIIATDQGLRSLKEIRNELKNGNKINISKNSSKRYNFSNYCSDSLIQIGLNVKLIIDGKNIRYVVDTPDKPIVLEGQYLFRPLFFIPYNNPEFLRYEDYPINQNHPFAQWLIEKAPILQKKYPGMLNAIRSEIPRYISYYDENKAKENILDIVNKINQILERLSRLDKAVRPPKGIFLKESDFQE